MAGFTRDSDAVPTTREILLAASTLIHADGAGLHKRPDGVSYTNKHIPTLVAATPDGRLIGKLDGYRGREALVKFLKESRGN